MTSQSSASGRGPSSVPTLQGATAALLASVIAMGIGAPAPAIQPSVVQPSSQAGDSLCPPALVLAPTSLGGSGALMAHRSHSSHSSHSSHASHASHYSGSSPSSPAPAPYVPPPTRPPVTRTPSPNTYVNPSPTDTRPTILATLEKKGSFDVLISSLRKSGLADSLNASGTYTLFAPTDEAFRALPAADLLQLMDPANKERLTRVLRVHLVPTIADSSSLKAKSSLTTSGGQAVGVATVGQSLLIERSRITEADLRCSNGIIHVVDSVVLPADKGVVAALKDSGYSTMAKLIEHSTSVRLFSADWPVSVFAPTEAAFAKLPAGTVDDLLLPSNREKLDAFVQRHLLVGRVFTLSFDDARPLKPLGGEPLRVEHRGSLLLVGGAVISNPDLGCTNGVVHGISDALAKP